MSTLSAYKITFKNGKSEVVTGKVHLFSESNPVVPVTNNLNVYNADAVLSIKEVIQEHCPKCGVNTETIELYVNDSTYLKQTICPKCGCLKEDKIIR